MVGSAVCGFITSSTVGILTFMSKLRFMLSSVQHEKVLKFQRKNTYSIKNFVKNGDTSVLIQYVLYY